MDTNARRRGVIKKSQVRLDEAGAQPRKAAAAQAEPARRAQVRLTRLDENTQVIELTCSCGEVSLIEIRTEKQP
jgi:hypothetical protein